MEKTAEIEILNIFDVLNQEKPEEHHNSSILKNKENTKDWVNKGFGKTDTLPTERVLSSNKGNKDHHQGDKVEEIVVQIKDKKHVQEQQQSKEGEQTYIDSREIIMMEKDNKENQQQVLEDVIPLAIKARNMMEIAISKKEDLDVEYLVDNIAEAVVRQYLSPK